MKKQSWTIRIGRLVVAMAVASGVGTHYEKVAHKPSDTFDKVDPLNLKADAAIVAVTAYVLAQSDPAIAPHVDQAAVAEILELALVYRLWKP